MSTDAVGFPSKEGAAVLRIEGLVIFAATLLAYYALGANWWIFALLILAPDLAMLGALAGPVFGARAYNAAHTYMSPLALGAAAWFTDTVWMLPYGLIWIAHIGLDRALGYGLKYPSLDQHTHLGLIGKAMRAQRLADPR